MTNHQRIADAGRHIVFAADGALLVSGKWPEGLTRYVGPTWDAVKRVDLRDLTCALAASPTAPEVCLGMKTAMFFDAHSLKKRPGSLKGHKYQLGAVAYAPDGLRVFTGGGGHITPPDHTIRLFDRAGIELARVPGPAGEVRRLGALDDTFVVALDTTEGLAGYDMAADRRRWLVPQPESVIPHGPFALDAAEGRVYAALHADGGDSAYVLAVLDARTGDELSRTPLFTWADRGHIDDVVLVGSSIAISMGQNAGSAAARKARVHLFDRATGARGEILEATEQTGRLAVSPDGRFLAATMHGDLGIAVFDMCGVLGA